MAVGSRGMCAAVAALLVACSSEVTVMSPPGGQPGVGGGSVAGSTVSSAAGGSDGGAAVGGGGYAPACDRLGDPWVTYGHDAQRSFATCAWIKGPLTTVWRYEPTFPPEKTITAMSEGVATQDRVVIPWTRALEGYPLSNYTPFIDALDGDGSFAWRFDVSPLAEGSSTLSLAFGQVAINQNGLRYLDEVSGEQTFFAPSLSSFGATAPVADRLYVTDEWGSYVSAYDASGTQLWKHEQLSGPMAEDGGVLFVAGGDGLHAFDGATGEEKWFMPTVLENICAGDGLLFGCENHDLVARHQNSGGIAWTAAGCGQLVLAAGMVIVRRAWAIAYRADNGEKVWTAQVGTPLHDDPSGMVAALASGTLLVIADSMAFVLDLATGAEQWSGPIDTTQQPGGPIVVGDRIYVVDYATPALVAAVSAP